MRIARVRAGGHGYARAGGVILKMGKWGAPVVVGKNEQASSAKFFSGTARRRGQIRRRLPLKRICAQYGFGFFAPKNLNPYPAQLSVKGVCQGGSSVPLDRILVPFVRTKGTPRRRAVQIMPLQKAARRRRRLQTGPRRIGEIKPSHSLCRQPLSQPCG